MTGGKRGVAQGRMRCSAVFVVLELSEGPRGRAVPIEEDVAFQCTDAPLAGGNPACRLKWYSNK